MRIVFCTPGYRVSVQTMTTLWPHSPPAGQGAVPLEASPSQPDRYQARRQGITLYDQGWTQRRIRRVLHVSRPTVRAWIGRFEAEPFAGLVAQSRTPTAPARKGWLAWRREG